MTKPAELRAKNLETPGLSGCEVKREIQPRHKVLLNPQFADIEGMADVFGMHQEMNLSIYWNRELGGDDIVASLHVVRRIQAEIVLISFIDFVGMKRPKLSVRARVPKIKSKLPRLRLNLQCVRLG